MMSFLTFLTFWAGAKLLNKLLGMTLLICIHPFVDAGGCLGAQALNEIILYALLDGGQRSLNGSLLLRLVKALHPGELLGADGAALIAAVGVAAFN